MLAEQIMFERLLEDACMINDSPGGIEPAFLLRES